MSTELQQLQEDISRLEARNKFLMEFIEFNSNKNDCCPNCNEKGYSITKQIMDYGWNSNKKANVGLFKSICAKCEHISEYQSTYYNM